MVASLGLAGALAATAASAPSSQSHNVTERSVSMDLSHGNGTFKETLLLGGTQRVQLSTGDLTTVEALRAGDQVAMENGHTGLVLGNEPAPSPTDGSSDPRGSKIQDRRVVATIFHVTEDLVTIRTPLGDLRATPEHPFFVEGVGWQGAGKLRPGDRFETAWDGTVRVLSVQRDKVPPTAVYNLSVEGTHTYYVGPEAALVHNVGGDGKCTVGPTPVAGPDHAAWPALGAPARPATAAGTSPPQTNWATTAQGGAVRSGSRPVGIPRPPGTTPPTATGQSPGMAGPSLGGSPGVASMTGSPAPGGGWGPGAGTGSVTGSPGVASMTGSPAPGGWAGMAGSPATSSMAGSPAPGGWAGVAGSPSTSSMAGSPAPRGWAGVASSPNPSGGPARWPSLSGSAGTRTHSNLRPTPPRSVVGSAPSRVPVTSGVARPSHSLSKKGPFEPDFTVKDPDFALPRRADPDLSPEQAADVVKAAAENYARQLADPALTAKRNQKFARENRGRAYVTETPPTLSVIYNSKTGQITYGTSGLAGRFDHGDVAMDPRVQRRLPDDTRESWPVHNCAEIGALNCQASHLPPNKPLTMDEFTVYAIDTTSLVPKRACRNCTRTLSGANVPSGTSHVHH